MTVYGQKHKRLESSFLGLSHLFKLQQRGFDIPNYGSLFWIQYQMWLLPAEWTLNPTKKLLFLPKVFLPLLHPQAHVVQCVGPKLSRADGNTSPPSHLHFQDYKSQPLGEEHPVQVQVGSLCPVVFSNGTYLVREYNQ